MGFVRFMGAAVNCTASWMAAAEAWARRWIEMTYISMAAALWIARAVVGLVSTQGTEWQSEKSPLLPAAQSMHKDNRCPRAGMRGSTAWSFSRCSCINWFHHNLIICILSLHTLGGCYLEPCNETIHFLTLWYLYCCLNLSVIYSHCLP